MTTAYNHHLFDRGLLLTGAASLTLMISSTACAAGHSTPSRPDVTPPTHTISKAAPMNATLPHGEAKSGDAFAWDLLCTPTASGHRRGFYPAESPTPSQASPTPPADYDDDAFQKAIPRNYVGMGDRVIPTGYQGISGPKLYQLGDCYEHGHYGYEQNIKRALGCYLSGAAKGDVACITRIAEIFRDGGGSGVSNPALAGMRNPALADAWQKAAEEAKSRPVVGAEVPLSPIVNNGVSASSTEYSPANHTSPDSISHEHRGLSGSQVFKMGDDFEKGKNGKPKDMQRAIGCYLSGAAMGNVYCIARMGACYRLGNGVPKNPQLAADWYEAAAAKGEAGSMYRLGEAYEKGEGRPLDLDRARELYSQAAAKGDALSAKALRRIGQSSTKPATSGSTSGSAASSGDLHSPADYVDKGSSSFRGLTGSDFFNMGDDFEKGKNGSQKDMQRAIECYLTGSAMGNVYCIARMGACYRLGNGVPKNPQLAADWYEAAAAKGEAGSMYRLGEAYEKGEGRPLDLDRARELYSQAAAKGDALSAKALRRIGQSSATPAASGSTFGSAASSGDLHSPADYTSPDSVSHEHRGLSGSQVFKMGDDFEKGKNGKPKDMQRAIGCYLTGSAMGNVYCIARMGACYRLGNGVPKNPQLAADWYEAAAAKGEAGSMYRLGEAYEKGEGRPLDLDRARELYSQAAAKGDTLSAKALRRLNH